MPRSKAVVTKCLNLWLLPFPTVALLQSTMHSAAEKGIPLCKVCPGLEFSKDRWITALPFPQGHFPAPDVVLYHGH